MTRFDEVELEAIPMIGEAPPQAYVAAGRADAPRVRRLLALFVDLSLFVALGLALSPLLAAGYPLLSVASLGGFILMTSYYYFVGSWLLWGKTVGGAIFDVRVTTGSGAAMPVSSASIRWAGLCASLLTGGLGLALAVLPSRLSLPDRLSQTRCVIA